MVSKPTPCLRRLAAALRASHSYVILYCYYNLLPQATPGCSAANILVCAKGFRPSIMRYVEFATATNFSFLRGASHPEELMLQAQAIGLTGLGVCDRNTVAGVVRAHLAKREQN